MHAVAMLAEIVQTRPYFVFFGAIVCSATETLVRGTSRRYLVHAFLMPFQIIFGAESTFPIAVGFLTLKWACVPKHVFPDVRKQNMHREK